ncbi:hypothetical protein [Teredinibacter turnerae]|uniref:hypothetical protein n=1 Tax=Teredinibacter turnerae TaxID=2426 RepID=UPI0004139747|nr:hypothetical protein [Teredinibacter turnerae]
MSNKEHRLGVSEASLVVRHLKLEPVDPDTMQQVLAEIDEIYGLDAVSFDEKTQVLNIAYDAARICLDCIEEVLEKHKVQMSHDWWTNFKEGYYRFFDQNIKDNMNAKPMGCHGGVRGTKPRP